MESYFAVNRVNRKRAVRRVMLTILLTIVIVVPLGIVLLRRFERALTFYPVRYDAGEAWRLPDDSQDVWFEAADGTRLHGWFVGAPVQPATATIIYFHGNGGNLSGVGWIANHFTARGFDVMLFDYRGYGRSEGAAIDERGIFADADAAYDYVVRERGVPPARLVLYGQSLGTTAVADVASRKPCGGVILESGLSSASDMAGVVLPWLPRAFHRLARNRFESARKLAGVECPILVAHGDMDEVIPIEQGRALYAAAREPKRLIIVSGASHNNLVAIGGENYLDAVAAFIRASVEP
ncbi:MAG TPA: alpha/beta fold hydrolase [Pyrinomonadaceae bacterium]|nr:alpha/beta fold hydrolase [Pyrinomonadaceae bacterium]